MALRDHVHMSAQIEWRTGPAGPRAALVEGPDVWEVVATYRTVGNRAEPTARHLGLDPAEVDAALSEYRANPTDVDERIRCEIELASRAYSEWLAARS
jgi:hypothetical protein